MISMTLNQELALFENIATAHDMIEDFASGEIWEIEKKMNKNAKYNMLYVSPVQSGTFDNVKQRTYMVLVMDIPSKDESNVNEVWSDSEQILDDVIELLRSTSNDYELIGDPILLPFKEDHSDWVAGYRAEVTIQTKKGVNRCNIPADDFVSPSDASFQTVTIKDQDGNVLSVLKGGQSYEVIVATGINDDLTATVTVIDQI